MARSAPSATNTNKQTINSGSHSLGRFRMPIDFNQASRNPQLEDAEARVNRVRETLKRDVRAVVKYLFPKATFTSHEARIGDVYGTKGASLSIVLKPHVNAGLWVDHATNGDQGDIFALWAAARGLHDFNEVLKETEAWIGGETTPGLKKHEAKVKKQKLEKDPELKKQQEAEYTYYDVYGSKVCTVYRYALIGEDGEPTGKKTFSIYRYSDKKWAAPPVRPLYRLPDIINLTDVVLVEGEKCADALAAHGIDATTASGGSNTLIDKTDWTPLAGKRVYLWPDHDEPGHDYMERIGDYLESIGCEVFHIPIPDDAEEGWDAADAIEEGYDIIKLIREALPEDAQDRILSEWWDDISYEYEGEVMEDILPRIGLATLFGPSTGGKSFIVLDLVYRIAMGELIFGKETEPCGIAYCAFEGYHGLKKRIHAIKQFREVSGVAMELIDSPWLISDDKQWAAFCSRLESARMAMEARGTRLGIVVVDTLTSATAGADTNSQADVTAAMKKLKRLAFDMGLLILNVGHTGKEVSKGMVGSFAYKSEADAFLECRIEKDEKTDKVIRRSLWIDKVKDGASGFVISDYTLDVVSIGQKPNGNDITTCLVGWHTPLTERQEEVQITQRMQDHSNSVLLCLSSGAKYIEELEKELSLSRSRLSEILSVLNRRGKVYARTVARKKIWHLKGSVEDEETE